MCVIRVGQVDNLLYDVVLPDTTKTWAESVGLTAQIRSTQSTALSVSKQAHTGLIFVAVIAGVPAGLLGETAGFVLAFGAMYVGAVVEVRLGLSDTTMVLLGIVSAFVWISLALASLYAFTGERALN